MKKYETKFLRRHSLSIEFYDAGEESYFRKSNIIRRTETNIKVVLLDIKTVSYPPKIELIELSLR